MNAPSSVDSVHGFPRSSKHPFLSHDKISGTTHIACPRTRKPLREQTTPALPYPTLPDSSRKVPKPYPTRIHSTLPYPTKASTLPYPTLPDQSTLLWASSISDSDGERERESARETILQSSTEYNTLPCEFQHTSLHHQWSHINGLVRHSASSRTQQLSSSSKALAKSTSVYLWQSSVNGSMACSACVLMRRRTVSRVTVTFGFDEWLAYLTKTANPSQPNSRIDRRSIDA